MSHAMLCRECGSRPARYRDRNGKLKADKEHDLCLQCFRAMREKQQAGEQRMYDARPSRGHHHPSKHARRRRGGVL